MTSCAPMDPITNVSLSGMPPCRPMKLPMQGGQTNIERRGGSGVVRTCARTMGITYLAKPIPERHWDYTHSIGMIKTIFENEMYPLTLNGIENGMRALALMAAVYLPNP